MAYSPTTWVQGVTTLGPTNLNHIEGGLATADATASAAVPKSVVTVAGDLVYATGSAAVTRLGIGSATQVLKGGASAPAWGAVALTELSGYPADATKFARGDGTWAVPLAGTGIELGYTEFTANVTMTPALTEGASSQIVVTAPAVAFDGTAVLMEFWCPSAASGSGGMTTILYDNTAAASLGWLDNMGANLVAHGFRLARRFTPAAGTRTYSIRSFFASGGAGTYSAGAGGAGVLLPGFIRITKV